MSRYILSEPVRLVELISAVAPFAHGVAGSMPLDANVRALLALDETTSDDTANQLTHMLDSWPELSEYCGAGAPLVVLSRSHTSVGPPTTDAVGGPARITITLATDTPWPLVHDAIATLTPTSADEVDLNGVQVLTDVVDHVGEALNGSIIVEDHAFQMLAYSRGIGELDEARRVAILERRLPDVYQKAFNAQGIIAKLAGGQEIVYVEAVPAIGLGPRLVVAIRHEGEFLGSLWLARDSSSFAMGDEQILRRAATHLGPLLRKMMRAKSAQQRQLHDTLTHLLIPADSVVAAENLSRTVGLPETTQVHVLRFFVRPTQRPSPSLLQPIRNSAEAVGRSMRIRTFSVVETDCVKVIILGCADAITVSHHEHPVQFAKAVRSQLGTSANEVSVAIGEHQTALAHAWKSDVDAENTVRGMLSHYKPIQIASMRDVWAESSMDELLSSAQGSLIRHTEPLDAMVASDDKRQTDYVATLSAILDSWGDIRTAAGRLHIHPNTLRYRIARMSESFTLDLENPVQRIVLQLQLLVHGRFTYPVNEPTFHS